MRFLFVIFFLLDNSILCHQISVLVLDTNLEKVNCCLKRQSCGILQRERHYGYLTPLLLQTVAKCSVALVTTVYAQLDPSHRSLLWSLSQVIVRVSQGSFFFLRPLCSLPCLSDRSDSAVFHCDAKLLICPFICCSS